MIRVSERCSKYYMPPFCLDPMVGDDVVLLTQQRLHLHPPRFLHISRSTTIDWLTMPSPRDRAKLSQACSYCRRRKVKCKNTGHLSRRLAHLAQVTARHLAGIAWYGFSTQQFEASFAAWLTCFQDHDQQCRYLPLQRRGRKNHSEYLRGTTRPVDSGQSAVLNSPGRNDFSSDQSSASQVPLGIPGSAQGMSIMQFSPPVPSPPACIGADVPEPSYSTPAIQRTTITGRVPGPQPAPGLGIDQMLTPRESEVDREEATMELQNVSSNDDGPVVKIMLIVHR